MRQTKSRMHAFCRLLFIAVEAVVQTDVFIVTNCRASFGHAAVYWGKYFLCLCHILQTLLLLWPLRHHENILVFQFLG